MDIEKRIKYRHIMRGRSKHKKVKTTEFTDDKAFLTATQIEHAKIMYNHTMAKRKKVTSQNQISTLKKTL